MVFDTDAPAWLASATPAFATRRVSARILSATHLDDSCQALPGDLMLAQVRCLGHCTTLDDAQGRPQPLQPGAYVVVACGHAPDQAPHLAASHDWELTARGGVATSAGANQRQARATTCLWPLGLLVDPAERSVNTRRYGLEDIVLGEHPRPAISAVIDGNRNEHQQCPATAAIQVLRAAGKQVAAARLTGSSSAAGLDALRAAGATQVLDFTDAGHADTSGLRRGALLQIFRTLVSNLVVADVDAIVLTLADPEWQPETTTLLEAPEFRRQLDSLAPDTTRNSPPPDPEPSSVCARMMLHCRQAVTRRASSYDPVLHSRVVALPQRLSTISVQQAACGRNATGKPWGI